MTTRQGAAGPVRPTTTAAARLTPLDASAVTLGGGFWGDRVQTNRDVTIPHGFAQLERVGTLGNFRLAAGTPGEYQALGTSIGQVFPFLDSDLYKWLEAVGWELGRAPDPELAGAADRAIADVAAAQRADGYLNTFVQVVGGGRAYRDLEWGHELYCYGHLIQAAVAWHRALDDDRLLEIAWRTVDSIEAALGAGPQARAGVDGHPEIETALVEMYRVTGERRLLDLAQEFVERRGRGLLAEGRFGAAYWQDHAPVRSAPEVAGHAVRQMYLDAGAVDVAVETGDDELLGAVRRRWRDMIASRMSLTGGIGSRHTDEAFGDPYELSPDQVYNETCAAISSVMLSWRLLLATGDPDAADHIERTIFNAVLPGLALDGTRFFYVNPLQRRTHRAVAPGGPGEGGGGERAPWFACACCPPNLMRTLSSWEGYLATTDSTGIQIQQYASAELSTDLPGGGRATLRVETDYPWSGRVAVTIVETADEPWTLGLRVPSWCRSATLVDGSETIELEAGVRIAKRRRSWHAGDVVVLDLAMPVRITTPDPRVDAVRGTLAIERGPLVYAIETADLPAGVELEEIEIEPDVRPEPIPRDDVAPGLVGLRLPAFRRRFASASGTAGDRAITDEPIEVGAVPYFAWGNRSVEAMRVWIPRRGN
ncbi:MAG: glycoside hydrolase family 127 protein [Chloroflexi bacterium]|nr:glycoside hydrolase family 127 protein [Chloroflexota bacterium]